MIGSVSLEASHGIPAGGFSWFRFLDSPNIKTNFSNGLGDDNNYGSNYTYCEVLAIGY